MYGQGETKAREKRRLQISGREKEPHLPSGDREQPPEAGPGGKEASSGFMNES